MPLNTNVPQNGLTAYTAQSDKLPHNAAAGRRSPGYKITAQQDKKEHPLLNIAKTFADFLGEYTYDNRKKPALVNAALIRKFGKNNINNAQSFAKPCSLQFGSIVFEFENEKRAEEALGSILEKQKTLNLHETERSETLIDVKAVRTKFEGRHYVTIPREGTEVFLVTMLGYDSKFHSKVRDIATAQRAQQEGNVELLKPGTEGNISHNQLNPNTINWVEKQDVEGKGKKKNKAPKTDQFTECCAIGFGDAISLDVLLKSVPPEIQNNVKLELAKWTFTKTKNIKDQVGLVKGAYSLKKGWLTQQQVACVIYESLGEVKDKIQETNKILNEVNIAVLKQSIEKLTNPTNKRSQHQENALIKRTVALIKAVDVSLIDTQTLSQLINAELPLEITQAIQERTPEIFALVEGAYDIYNNNPTWSSKIQTATMEELEQLCSYIATTDGKGANDKERISPLPYQLDRELALKAATKNGSEATRAILILKIFLKQYGSKDKGKIDEQTQNELLNLIKRYPLAASHLVKTPKENGYQQRDINTAYSIFANSGRAFLNHDDNYFVKVKKEMSDIKLLRESAQDILKEYNENTKLTDVLNDMDFLSLLAIYERKFLKSYYPDLELFLSNDPQKLKTRQEQLKQTALRPGIDVLLPNSTTSKSKLPGKELNSADEGAVASTSSVAGETPEIYPIQISPTASTSGQQSWTRTLQTTRMQRTASFTLEGKGAISPRGSDSSSVSAQVTSVQQPRRTTSPLADKNNWTDDQLIALFQGLLDTLNTENIASRTIKSDAKRLKKEFKPDEKTLAKMRRPKFYDIMAKKFGEKWEENKESDKLNNNPNGLYAALKFLEPRRSVSQWCNSTDLESIFNKTKVPSEQPAFNK